MAKSSRLEPDAALLSVLIGIPADSRRVGEESEGLRSAMRRDIVEVRETCSDPECLIDENWRLYDDRDD